MIRFAPPPCGIRLLLAMCRRHLHHDHHGSVVAASQQATRAAAGTASVRSGMAVAFLTGSRDALGCRSTWTHTAWLGFEVTAGWSTGFDARSFCRVPLSWRLP